MSPLFKMQLAWVVIAFFMAAVTGIKFNNETNETKPGTHFLAWVFMPVYFPLILAGIIISRIWKKFSLKKELIDFCASVYVDLFP